MSRIVLGATVSVDGYIADPQDRVGPLFDWYTAGSAPVSYGDEQRRLRTGQASASLIEERAAGVGACVIGRRLFDLTNGWGGRPPASDAVFVVTHRPVYDWAHEDAPFTFVDGVTAAVELARRHADGRDVSVAGGDVGSQALRAGLIDEIHLEVAPVVLGSGRRFFGDDLRAVMLDNPRVIEGDRVTHLMYRVRRDRPVVMRSNAELRAAVDATPSETET